MKNFVILRKFNLILIFVLYLEFTKIKNFDYILQQTKEAREERRRGHDVGRNNEINDDDRRGRG